MNKQKYVFLKCVPWKTDLKKYSTEVGNYSGQSGLYEGTLSCLSSVQLFVTLWSVACLAPLSIGFAR